MRVEVVSDFVTKTEAATLNEFVFSSIKDKKFLEGVFSRHANPSGTQMVSRFNPTIVFPELAICIQEKLRCLLNLKQEDIHTNFHPTGIVVNCSFTGAQVLKHKDPTQHGASLLRCNLITSKADSGGNLVVDDAIFDVPECGIYFCLVSEHEHSVTKVLGNKPRIVWQFGFNVSKNAWDSGYIKVQ